MSNRTETQAMYGENNKQNVTRFGVYNKIPYALINRELDGCTTEIFQEFREIMEYYKKYKKGVKFNAEGTGNHYVAAQLRYKKVATLINKEARFLFGVTPDIVVDADGDVGKITEDAKSALTTMQNLVDKVLSSNKFESILVKAAKDCFIAKRIALMCNFNEEYGVTLQFIPALNFVYETKFDNSEVLTKFVCFTIVKDRNNLSEKRIFKKKFTLEQVEDADGNTTNICYLEEAMYDGTGRELEIITEYQPTLLDRIPVAIIINDGLTGETSGESEVEALQNYEEWYSKLSSADIDAERKGMNQIKYAIDMSSNSTKNLSTSPGSFWDLTSDQNLDKPAPAIGTLDNNMSYSGPLDTTLRRIRASMYEEVDVPDVTLENIQGIITSGKAMKCMYWPLIVRCQEKMKTWAPAIQYIIDVIIRGAMVYPNCIKKYMDDFVSPVDYEIEVVQNYPLPEDEQEEKQMDLAEVAQKTMSLKAYMKKWRKLTDHEVEEELQQMAYESSLLEGTMTGEADNFDSKDGFEEEGRDTDPVTGNTIENENTSFEGDDIFGEEDEPDAMI